MVWKIQVMKSSLDGANMLAVRNVTISKTGNLKTTTAVKGWDFDIYKLEVKVR